jgi:ribosomal protein S24E
MELKITEDRENALFNRREISMHVHGFEATPKREEIKQELCKKLNLNPELTVIVKIDQRFGVKQCTVHARSYRDKESLERYTEKYILDRASSKKRAAAKQEAAPQKQPEQKEAKAEAKPEQKKPEQEKPKV